MISLELSPPKNPRLHLSFSLSLSLVLLIRLSPRPSFTLSNACQLNKKCEIFSHIPRFINMLNCCLSKNIFEKNVQVVTLLLFSCFFTSRSSSMTDEGSEIETRCQDAGDERVGQQVE